MSPDPISRRATCACGALVLVCEGEPVRRSMCHCLSCKQRTGSIFGVHARYARDKVTATGATSEYVRVGDEGGRITHRFCPTCGTTVYWDIDSIPGFFTVAVGAFADPAFPPPTVSVYEDRRSPWAVMPSLAVEHFE